MNDRHPALRIATFLLVWCCGITLQADELPASATDNIERILSQLAEKSGAPGLSVAVARDHQLCYTRTLGMADLEHQVPVSSETRFRTASIAKTMTAVLILSLAEDGMIDLDADIRGYCPEYPDKRWPVSTRRLLGHLGGVRHYDSRAESTSTQHFGNLRAALSAFADDPLKHEPGTKFLYSTFGYNLLGSVAEGAGKRSFMELLDERVLAPAEMTHTVADDQRAVIPGRAGGYLREPRSQLEQRSSGNLQGNRIMNAPLHDTSMKIPGGGLLSTPSDLIRFAIAVNTGKLSSNETREMMWTSQATVDGKQTSYGLGWKVGHHSGRKVVSHTGGQAGTSTVLLLVPETGTSVAIMCNLQHVALLQSAFAIADAVQPPPPPTDYSAALDALQAAIRNEVEQKQLPAFSISLVDQARVVWADGFGYQDAPRTKPATANTVYRVGSISKLFTDIAVLQLVETGALDLDTPVEQYLPEFKPHNPYGISLTLRQLMSHRSGLVRESPVGNYFDPTEPSLAETVASLNDTALIYQPESKTKYSNAAIAVVGAILERNLNVTHPERVQKAILDPLQMNQSSFTVTPDLEPNLAVGWMWTYDQRRFQAPTFLLGTGPAGNLYSSVLDLSKFLTCLFDAGQAEDGRILQRETWELMTTPIEDAAGNPQGFGLGFHIDELDGFKQIGHGGAVYGFSTQLEAIPARQLGVAAAASLDGSNGVVRRLADYALRLMIATQDGQPLPAYRTTRSVPAERAAELTGLYRESNEERFTRITELDGDVWMQRGSFRIKLGAAADTGVILTDDVFEFGTEVSLPESDRLLVADVTYQRVPDLPPPPAPAHWEGLIGEYGWDHNTLYILEDEGQLYALIEWFYYYPLREVSENGFEFPDYGLYHGEGLTFTRDTHGRATQVVAAEVAFQRREVGTKDGETFKITPVRPIDDLRAGALAATPLVETGTFREPDLIELVALDPTVKLDIRYATTNNFTGSVFYRQPRAFMQRPAAEAVVRAHRRLEERGLGLLIHDAYRPWHVTKMFWDATPDELKDFVANPANGSRHNRGCAVDLTLYDRLTGKPIEMVAGYDEFSPRSFPLYPGGTGRQRWYRERLRRTMEAEGFTIYEFEWWHFDYQDWKQYRIGNRTFEEIDAP